MFILFIFCLTGNTQLNLVSSGPLDYEKLGSSFSVDVLVENRHFTPTLSLDSSPLKAVVRINVTLKNAEDEKPKFFPETLFNVVDRNSELR